MEEKVNDKEMEKMISDALDYKHQFYNMLDRYNKFKKVLDETLDEYNVSKSKELCQKLEDLYVFEKVYYVKFEECKTYSNQWKNSEEEVLKQGYEFRNKTRTLYSKYQKLLNRLRLLLITGYKDYNIDELVEEKQKEYKKNLEECFGK